MIKCKDIESPNLVRDVLINLTWSSGASVDYAQGVIVACISMIMAYENCSYLYAVGKIKPLLPDNYRLEAFPSTWKADFKKDNSV